MNKLQTLIAGYMTPLALLTGLPLSAVQAADTVVTVESSEQQKVELNQAELDQMLAPIALYPDTLLSHILVASTYPLEVVQAARWRNSNKDLTEQQTLDAAEAKDWDPSVKALTPFTDLLNKLSDDLNWLQDLGDAFLANEEQVLSTLQNLRHKAYEQGSLANNEYIEVEQDQDEIVIETVQKEVVYVPYYDTRVVYGNWWWDAYPPLYWHTPVHYVSYAGFYWGPRVVIRPSFYFGGFQWHRRQVVVNYEYRHHPYPIDRHQRVRTKEYQRWQHNRDHRRNARYMNNKVIRSAEYGGARHATVNRDSGHMVNRQVTGPQPIRGEHQQAAIRAQSVQKQLRDHRNDSLKANPSVRLNQHNVVKQAQRSGDQHDLMRQPSQKWNRDNNQQPIRKVEGPTPELKSYRAQRELPEPVRPRITEAQQAKSGQATVNREVSVVRPNKVERMPDHARTIQSSQGVKRSYSRPAVKPVRPSIRHKDN
ncbi:DUF3300 domain-containing protein [Neptunicella sp.]|uniref:DUF3300 domain-containing protein n=1 Tax=Neptunicella sp. TaxID=2125986 RepID=UPI003F68C83C